MEKEQTTSQLSFSKSGIPSSGPYVLVLGGTGFIGSAVIDQLKIKKQNILATVHRSRPENCEIPTIHADIRSFDWHLLDENPPSAIIHLARISGRRKLTRYIAGWRGYLASKKLIRWMKSVKNPPHLVYVSGTLVYGDCNGAIIDETAPLNPIAFQRDYIRAEYPFLEHIDSDLPISIVRPPWVIGAGSWFQQFYVEPCRKTGEIRQYGSGENMMSLIHVEDCARQITEVALSSERGNVYNLVSCEPISHAKFCTITADLLQAKITEISNHQLRRKYGKTVYEALTFSSRITSRHRLIQQLENRYPTARQAIEEILDER